MELEPVLGGFDDAADLARAGKIDLSQPASCAAVYLRQVALERDTAADVVTASGIDLERYAAKQTVKVKEFKKPPPKVAVDRVPPRDWQDYQVAEFSELRTNVARLRARLKRAGAIPQYLYPELDSESGWEAFCFKKCTTQVKKESEANSGKEALKPHKGTPPYLKVVLGMSQPLVINGFGIHVEFLIEKGWSTARAHWLFALMAVLEKPLEADTVASLRDLARYCAEQRAAVSAENAELQQDKLRAFSWFICIVSRYFGQADLADDVPESTANS